MKTKSIYEPVETEDGVRVLITRYYPRGVKKDRFDERIPALSPSRELLASYRSGSKSWGQFIAAFLSEIRANPESLEAIQRLSATSQKENVTLLCYEKPGLPCHRYVVRDILLDPSSLAARKGSRTASQQ